MKKLIIIMLASGLLAAGACEKAALSRAGFSSPLTPGASGQAALSVSHKAKDIQLKGTITLSEGQVELELLDPDQTRRYFQTIQAQPRRGRPAGFQKNTMLRSYSLLLHPQHPQQQHYGKDDERDAGNTAQPHQMDRPQETADPLSQ